MTAAVGLKGHAVDLKALAFRRAVGDAPLAEASAPEALS